jgi:hypothetical protein
VVSEAFEDGSRRGQGVAKRRHRRAGDDVAATGVGKDRRIREVGNDEGWWWWWSGRPGGNRSWLKDRSGSLLAGKVADERGNAGAGLRELVGQKVVSPLEIADLGGLLVDLSTKLVGLRPGGQESGAVVSFWLPRR